LLLFEATIFDFFIGLFLQPEKGENFLPYEDRTSSIKRLQDTPLRPFRQLGYRSTLYRSYYLPYVIIARVYHFVTVKEERIED